MNWIDVYLGKYKWYRKLAKTIWYKHRNTYQLSGLIFSSFWAKYGEINRFTKVIKIENYGRI